jgi:ABC-2 type transport system permease protein
MSLAYLRAEALRTLRNPRYLLFTLGIPLLLFLVIGNAYDGDVAGVSAQTWYMINMATFGAMGAVLGTGARIAVERDAGWNRQLRLTPLTPQTYVVTKVVVGMALALPAMLLVGAAGALTGKVHLDAAQWAGVLLVTWVALLPLAAIGVGIGYLARGDGAQAVNGGVLMLLSMFGGLWFPLDGAPAWMSDIAHATPTYWLGQVSRAPITGSWPALVGWAVLVAWALAAVRVAARRYRVDAVRAA